MKKVDEQKKSPAEGRAEIPDVRPCFHVVRTPHDFTVPREQRKRRDLMHPRQLAQILNIRITAQLTARSFIDWYQWTVNWPDVP